MGGTFHRENALGELRKGLASYFAVSQEDVWPLLSDLLLSLEAEVMILEKYTSRQGDPNFAFAHDSILMVARRLRSAFLEEMVAMLDASGSAKEFSANVTGFLRCIREMRSLHTKSRFA